MDNIEIKDFNIDEIFNEVINIKPQPLLNFYPLEFDITLLKDLFDFLLEFITMIYTRTINFNFKIIRLLYYFFIFILFFF